MLDRSQHQVEPFEIVSFAFVDHVSTIVIVVVASILVTMSSIEPTTEVLERLFLATDAPLGEAWLLSASIPLSSDSLHHLVLTSKIPSIIQARNSYGHFRTASQMHKASGLHWPSAAGLIAALQHEPLRLNPQPVSPALARLKMLHSDTIGGVLLVTTHYFSYGSISDPYITIIAAPACSTLGPFSADDPPGVNLQCALKTP